MKRSAPGTDVIIVGAGIIGCAVACELQRRGRSVLLLDRDSPGRRATWAAGGMLSPLTEFCDGNPFFDFAAHSLDLYPAFVQGLQDATGIDVDYRTAGKLHIVFDDEGGETLDRLAATRHAAAFGVRLITAEEARALEPALTTEVTRAAFVERDHGVDNRLLVQAAAAAAVALGAVLRVATPVERLLHESGRITGVQLSSGEQLQANHVVLAAGAWSQTIEGLPRTLPVRPRGGQMFAVDMRDERRAGAAFDIRHAIESDRCYLIPRSNGRLLVGATVEDAGFSRGPTVEGIASMLTAAISVAPGIADLPLIETWMDFRPGTPDDWPIIGSDPELDGLVYATGHFRNGILLAPATAEAVADIIDGRPASALSCFDCARFDALASV